MDAWDLQRFVTAQDSGRTWERALAEIRNGRKVSHWMWFVFPQLAALGRSSTATFYGLSGLPEAVAYLAHPVLGPRLSECTRAVLALSDTPELVFGPVDAMKLRSCMTLFAAAAPTDPGYPGVLNRFYDGVPDPVTVDLLG